MTKDMNMRTVGFIGWRGMVGSVLMERMREERDFDAISSANFITCASMCSWLSNNSLTKPSSCARCAGNRRPE